MKITEENYRTNRGHLIYLEELRQLSIKNRKNGIKIQSTEKK